MTNALSKLQHALEAWSFPYNCYEAVHPWTPWCSHSALDLGLTVFGEAIKLYTPLYLFSQLAQRRLDRQSFVNTCQSILRSTSFISTNAFFALLFFCSSQYFTGKFYYYAVAYIPGFLASALAVLIERPHRRSSLAFYVANVASEALFRIYTARGYIKPLKHGQVYMFTAAIASIMLLARRHGFDDDPLSMAIKLLVGPEEAGRRSRSSSPPTDSCQESANADNNDIQQSPSTLQQSPHSEPTSLEAPLQDSTPNTSAPARLLNLARASHRLCPHKHCSCARYTATAALRAFLIGSAGQLGFRLATKAPLLLARPDLLWPILGDTSQLKFGLFVSLFAGLYKSTNCLLRWSLDTSKPANCFIAGLVAGPALAVYPSPTVALYVLWKALEALFNEAVREGLIVNKNLYIVILYGLATSQLFYSAMMDPRYMKKSYMAFLDRISHNRLHTINRSVLDVFGTQASAGYEDFFPNLHPRFMSRAFLGSIWVWMIEHKLAAKQFQQW